MEDRQATIEVREMALSEGYSVQQVATVLNTFELSKVSIVANANNSFSILEVSGEIIKEDASIELLMETGHDVLRMLIDRICKNEISSIGVDVDTLLSQLNSMYENVQYSIKEQDGEKYLGLKL